MHHIYTTQRHYWHHAQVREHLKQHKQTNNSLNAALTVRVATIFMEVLTSFSGAPLHTYRATKSTVGAETSKRNQNSSFRINSEPRHPNLFPVVNARLATCFKV